MIERRDPLKKLIELRDNGCPKVIAGIRGCGKTHLLGTIYRNHLIRDGVDPENILMISLDDPDNDNLRNPFRLRDRVVDHCDGRDRCYVFIDEILMVHRLVDPASTDGEHVPAKPGDEHAITHIELILTLSSRSNIDLYVTGSRSDSLVSNVPAHFRDKCSRIHLDPLSFEEYYGHIGGESDGAFREYMTFGGMPSAVLMWRGERHAHLKEHLVFDCLGGIAARNALRKVCHLSRICDVLRNMCGKPLNPQKVADSCSELFGECPERHTVDKYLALREDSFVIRSAVRYDLKRRRGIGGSKKYYFTDLGLLNAGSRPLPYGDGRLLETLVFNELIRNGYSVSTGAFDAIEKADDGESARKTYEIDFYAHRDDRRYCIQVASDASGGYEALRRPLRLLRDRIQKVIVVDRSVKECRDMEGFTVVGAIDFIMRFIKRLR